MSDSYVSWDIAHSTLHRPVVSTLESPPRLRQFTYNSDPQTETLQSSGAPGAGPNCSMGKLNNGGLLSQNKETFELNGENFLSCTLFLLCQFFSDRRFSPGLLTANGVEPTVSVHDRPSAGNLLPGPRTRRGRVSDTGALPCGRDICVSREALPPFSLEM